MDTIEWNIERATRMRQAWRVTGGSAYLIQYHKIMAHLLKQLVDAEEYSRLYDVVAAIESAGEAAA